MFRSIQKLLKLFEQGKYDDILESKRKLSPSTFGVDTIEKYYDEATRQIIDKWEANLSSIVLTDTGRIQKQLQDIDLNVPVEEIESQLIEKIQSSTERKIREPAKKALNKLYDLIEERDNELSSLEERREEAVAAARRNLWKELSAKEKAEIYKRASDELQLKIEQLDTILKYETSITEEEKAEYEELLKDKQMLDEKYLAVRKQQISELSKEERLARYKSEAEEIAKNARLEKALAKEETKDNQVEQKRRLSEINLDTKNKLKETQEKYGLSKLEISTEQTTKLLGGISDLLSGKTGSAEGLMGTLFGESGMIAGTETAGVAGAAGMEALAGPIGIALMVLQTIAKVVGKINEAVAKGVDTSASMQTSYMSPINTRLQGLVADNRNYYNEMTDWSKENQDDFGLFIGRWNAFVDKQKYIEQLNTLVQSGIAYNAEERALLATISDKLVTTFDVMDASLTRLVRLQQRDMTYSALGSESLLTQFLNRFSTMGGIADTSYLSDVYDSVSATLLDAVSKLNADDATAFSYEVQKWLGALYSLGLSQEGVQSLAKGINYLQTGNVSELSSNQQLQYIYSAAAERAGLSIGDILIQGLDINTTNALLQNVVGLLQDIYNNSSTNAVQSAWTNITGLSISDLKAMTNVTSDYMAYISQEHQGWVSSWEETQKQISMIEDTTRTSIAEAITNIINNALVSVGDRIVKEQFASAGIQKTLVSDAVSNFIQGIGGYEEGGTADQIVSVIAQSTMSTADHIAAGVDSAIKLFTGQGTLSGIINDALGIGGVNKYSLYYLSDAIGGTVGDVVKSMITIPAVVQEVSEVLQDWGTGKEEADKLSWDEKLLSKSSQIYTVLENLEKDRIIERKERTAENVSMSVAMDNWKAAVDQMNQQVNYQNLFITMGLDMQNQNQKDIGSALNALTERLDNPPMVQESDYFTTYNQNTYSNDIYNQNTYSNDNYNTNNITNIDNTDTLALQSEINSITGMQASIASSLNTAYDSLIDTQLTTTAALNTFQSQADAIANSQISISNESTEDRALIEQASDIQRYLFENERLIRVSLSLLEPSAVEQLDHLSTWKTDRETMKELVEHILSIMRDKVPVDIIDNDVNTIVNNIYRTRYQY